jgi:hypothetical protein
MGKRSASRAWDTGSLAFMGALSGMMLVIAHEMHDIYFGRFQAADPFSHIMIEFAGATSGGALLFAAVSAIRKSDRAARYPLTNAPANKGR